ncbi:MAG: VanW family protein [Clostridiales bacterium]|nr:VanW family protein [Clostridiales bacterium]
MSKKKRSLWWLYTGIGLIGLVALIVIITLGDFNIDAEGEETPLVVVDPLDEVRERALAIRTRDTLLAGTSVHGVDVGDMSLLQAREAVQKALDTEGEQFSLTILADGGNKVLTGAALDFDSDIDEVLQTAYDFLRSGESDEETVRLAEEVAELGKKYDVTVSLSEESVAAYVATLALDYGTEPINATVKVDGTKLTYTDEKSGLGIDQETMTGDILAAFAGGKKEISVPTQVLEPVITRNMLETQYKQRAKFSTSFSGSTNDRKFNIRKGADLINGTVLAPGEVFSTNDALGVRTLKNGWKMAGAYAQGEVEQQAGGGVCQLSSTLYNAVVLSDLEIVHRRNHSMRVGYVGGGRDATINSVGNIIDFKFKNNTSGSIIVVAYTEGNSLHMEIFGIPFETTEYDQIKITSKRTNTVPIKAQETKDPKLPGGTQVVTREGKQGETWISYKEFYKDGKLVKTETLATSNYGMVPQLISVGTGPTPSPSATPAASPTPRPTPTPGSTQKPPDPTPDIPEE